MCNSSIDKYRQDTTSALKVREYDPIGFWAYTSQTTIRTARINPTNYQKTNNSGKRLVELKIGYHHEQEQEIRRTLPEDNIF